MFIVNNVLIIGQKEMINGLINAKSRIIKDVQEKIDILTKIKKCEVCGKIIKYDDAKKHLSSCCPEKIL